MATAVSNILEELLQHLQQWENNTLSDHAAAQLVHNSQRKLMKSCFCDSGVCCAVHSEHVTPHQNCILR